MKREGRTMSCAIEMAVDKSVGTRFEVLTKGWRMRKMMMKGG